MTLSLNGFSVTFESDTIYTQVEQVPDPSTLKEIRSRLGDEWFSHWADGRLYCLARVDDPTVTIGDPDWLDLTTHAGMKVAASLLSAAIPELFSHYDPVRSRPFAFLAQKQEFVAQAISGWARIPSLLHDFEIRPKYELDPRLVELQNGDLRIALVMDVTTRWVCRADIAQLSAAGVNVIGLHVVRRNPQPDQRRLVGRIAEMSENQVCLSDAVDGLDSIAISDVQLEGSKETFARCVRALLGGRYRDFNAKIDAAFAQLANGPGLDKALDQMEAHLKKKNPIEVPGGHRFRIGDRIRLRDSASYQSIVRLPPAKYCFDRAKTQLSDYAWSGLQQFGPFDRDSFPRRSPRILVICPDAVTGRVGQAIKLFRDGISSIPDSRFSSGFAGAFRLVNPDFKTLSIKLFNTPPEGVAGAYRACIEDYLARDSEFDAAFTVILEEHSALSDPINPYLVAKAVLLSNGIPVQEAKESTLTKPPQNLQYIFQNISTAMYAKMGGIPWTVDHGETADDELVIGLGTAELSGSRVEKRQRHVGITTVFRGDGNYLLSSLSRECKYDDYPEVLYESTTQVLREIKRRNGWETGDTVRVVFHIFKPLKNIEVAEIIKRSVDEVGADQSVEFAFLTVSHEHPFSLIDSAQQGITPRYANARPKGVFVPDRGLVVQLGQYTRLLCTNGPRMMKRADLPQPTPLLIHLHKESTYRDFPYLADQVLKFTALSWKSTLPTDRPVTIKYSSLIAELLARLKEIPDWSPALLNTKLKTSKWFL